MCKGQASTKSRNAFNNVAGGSQRAASDWSAWAAEMPPKHRKGFHEAVQGLDRAEQIWNSGKDREVALRMYQEAHDFAKLVQHNAMQATICMGFGYALLEAHRAREAFNMFVFARDVAMKLGNAQQADIAQFFAHTALVKISDVAAQHQPVNSRREDEGASSVLTPSSSPKMAAAKPNNSTQWSTQVLEEQMHFFEETEDQHEEETSKFQVQRRKRLSGRKLKKQKKRLAEAAEASLGQSKGDPSQPKDQDVQVETVQCGELNCLRKTSASSQGSTCMETSSSNDGSDLSYQTLSDTKEYTGLAECNSFESEAFAEPPFEALPHASLETAVVAPGLKPPPGLLPPPGLGALGTQSSYQSKVIGGVCYLLPIC